MRVIQTYCTFDGFKLRGGFETPRAMIAYLKESFKRNSTVTGYYTMFTDSWGADVLTQFICDDMLKVIEFPVIDDRFWNVCKLQSQSLMDEPYIHVDLDATLFELPSIDCDVITEMIRPASVGVEASILGLNHNPNIICSGLIGFNDIDFKNSYLNAALDLIKKSGNYPVNFEMMWGVEELLLSNMVKESGKTVFDLRKNNIKYEHLQGKRK